MYIHISIFIPRWMIRALHFITLPIKYKSKVYFWNLKIIPLPLPKTAHPDSSLYYYYRNFFAKACIDGPSRFSTACLTEFLYKFLEE